MQLCAAPIRSHRKTTCRRIEQLRCPLPAPHPEVEPGDLRIATLPSSLTFAPPSGSQPARLQPAVVDASRPPPGLHPAPSGKTSARYSAEVDVGELPVIDRPRRPGRANGRRRVALPSRTPVRSISGDAALPRRAAAARPAPPAARRSRCCRRCVTGDVRDTRVARRAGGCYAKRRQARRARCRFEAPPPPSLPLASSIPLAVACRRRRAA